MKRSKLIGHLLSKLHDLELGKDNSITEVSEFQLAKYSDASELLQFLEEVGMAPPEVAEPCPTYFIDPRTNQQIKVEDSTVFVRKWEDESSPKDSNEA